MPLFPKPPIERQLDAELRFHFEQLVTDRVHAGLSEEEARRQARLEFGGIEQVREACRDVRPTHWVETLLQDIRFGLRMLRRSPLFTGIAIVSLALGIGANTAVFSFARAIVFRQLPVARADRLVLLHQQNETFHIENSFFPYAFFREIRKQDPDFEDVIALGPVRVNVTEREETERLHGEFVSGTYFKMLGVRAAAGRLLDENDLGHVCVIGYRLWQERFQGRPDVIGRRLLIDDESFQIVGVTESSFAGAALHELHDIFAPDAVAAKLQGKDVLSAQLIARLKPGVHREEAQARLNVIGTHIEKAVGPRMTERDAFLLRDGSQGYVSAKETFGKPVLLLLMLVAIVLLAACANLTALLLVRSVERTQEAGIRVALGASRAALVRRFLTESLLLATAGGAVGWVVAQVLTRILLSLLAVQREALAAQLRPDAAVLGFSVAATLVCGILFGALPAWRASQALPLQAMRGETARSPGRSLGSRIFMAAQIALSLVLLFTAGLFAQTLRNLLSIDLGFQPKNVVLMRLNLKGTPYADKGAQAFFEDLLRRVRQMPDTRAASLARINVLSGSMSSWSLNIPGYIPPDRLPPVAYDNQVSSGYFRTLGIALLAGRDFIASDLADQDSGVIVNQELARRFFGGDALGKTFTIGQTRRHIIGISGSAKYRWLREEAQPIMYLPFATHTPESLYLQVRTAGQPQVSTGKLRALVQEMDRRVTVDSRTTMAMQIDQSLARERLLVFLSSLLGALTVALAAIGVYGVLAVSVTRRTREIGIRMAVGAPRERILGLLLRESLWMVVAGVALGVPLALACGRLAGSLLYGLKPGDPATVLVAVALLALVALAAAMIPAWRAARLDPVRALRHE